MKQLDVYYRALLQYRALTLQNRDCTMQRKAFAQANTSADRMTITRMICTVEEEWLDEIEKGLIFIEKAIKEERQFIYSNGEVEPIEKVKSISSTAIVPPNQIMWFFRFRPDIPKECWSFRRSAVRP